MHVSYDVHSNFAESVRHFFFFFFAHVHGGGVHLPAREGPQAAAESGIKGFSSATGFPPPFFHLKAVTKSGFTQQRGVKPGRPRFPPSVCKSPQTQGAAQPLEPQHVILSGFRERKLSRKRSGKKKKRNTGG